MYKIDDKNFKRIINFVVEVIKNNNNLFEKLREKDNEVNKFEFNIKKLINLIEAFKNRKPTDKNGQKILINHYGNPYITAIICLEGLLVHTEMVIAIEDVCYGLNMALVKIINDALKKYQIKTEIVLINNIEKEAIDQMNLDKIVCLGNSNSYMRFRKLENVEVKNVSLFDVSLYYDSEEYEELVDYIRVFAEKNFFEIEIFDETEDFEDVIYMINGSENQYCAVILSKDKEKQEKFKQEISSEIIVINQNPFKQFEYKIPKGIF